MPRTFDAIVVGSGLGGLTAGALYTHAGHRVLVLERSDHCGGAATTYKRGDLTIEVSLHQTDGLDEADPKRSILRALGIEEQVPFVSVGDFYELRGRLLGEPFVMPFGLDAALQTTSQRFPKHSQALREYFDLIRSVREATSQVSRQREEQRPKAEPTRPSGKPSPIARYARASVADVLGELFGADEAVKLALAANLAYYGDDPARVSFLWFAGAQASYHMGGGHYVRGGSQVLSDQLVTVIEAAGGAAEGGRTVTRILLDEQGHAVGVEHEASRPKDDQKDAQRDLAPVVFGNAAPHVLAVALPPEIRTDFMAPYANRPLSVAYFGISLGFSRKPSEFGVRHYSTILVPDWMRRLADYRGNAALLAEAPGERLPLFEFVDYAAIDSGLNSEAPFLGAITGIDRIDNWAGLSGDEYRERRNTWLNAIIGILDREFPGLASAVTIRDMATARTLQSFLNTPQGACLGFAPEPGQSAPPTARTPVQGLWLASAYTLGGGYTGAMLGGAMAAEAALRENRPT